MKNLSKDKRDRLILIAMGTVAALAGLWYGMLAPQRKLLSELTRKTAEETSRVANAQRLVSSTGDIQKDLEATSARLKAVEQTMASGDMYSWVIFTVNKFKANYTVEIPHFSREIPSEVGLLPNFPYRAVTFNIRGTAYYHDFGRFVADFENAFPYIRVQNIEMEPVFNPNSSASSNPTDPEKLSFRMEIVALVNPNSN
jgi:hypothetical protein